MTCLWYSFVSLFRIFSMWIYFLIGSRVFVWLYVLDILVVVVVVVTIRDVLTCVVIMTTGVFRIVIMTGVFCVGIGVVVIPD